ncbi:MAG TPA: hypothetical protein VLK85_15955 [Ramlibacter sp.]|nr:hypothetical protein [Ramlibacter sp.]
MGSAKRGTMRPMRFMSLVKADRNSETEDFGEALTPELREQEERLRAQVPGASGERDRN